MIPTIKFCRLTPTAKVPWKVHSADTGYDICADETLVLDALSATKIKTGIAAELPKGYGLAVRGRSGMTARGIFCPTGTVDEGYRGEICVTLCNLSGKEFLVSRGDRIGQLVLEEVVAANVADIPLELWKPAPTDRGANGFGSTGR